MSRQSIEASTAAIESLPDKHAIAKKYGVTVRTVDRWTKDRVIPFIKFGPRCIRFRWNDVDVAVDRLTIREVK